LTAQLNKRPNERTIEFNIDVRRPSSSISKAHSSTAFIQHVLAWRDALEIAGIPLGCLEHSPPHRHERRLVRAPAR
jgi:hypothetical protein